MEGIIFSCDSTKRFGLIERTGQDNFYFNCSALVSQSDTNRIRKGASFHKLEVRVRYEIGRSDKGEMAVKIVERRRSSSVVPTPSTGQALCPRMESCEVESCPLAHPKVRIFGKPESLMCCKLLNTKGKQLALKSPKFVLRMCCFFPNCTNGRECKYAHIQNSNVNAVIPNGHLLVAGELIRQELFEDNVGKRTALLGNKTGKLCNLKPCRFGERCRNLHRYIQSSVRQHIERLVHDQSTKETQPSGSPTSTCQICQEETNSKEGIECSNHHFTCDECFSGYVEQTWAEAQHEPGKIPDLVCADGGCRFVYTDGMVARHTTDSACAVYFAVRQQARDGITMGMAQAKLESILKSKGNQLENTDILADQLKNQLPHALMCPRCKHGPVDFAHCSDLGAHHGQIINGARIDNSCKNCHFFSANRSDWLPWDGLLQSVNQVEATRQPRAQAPVIHNSRPVQPRAFSSRAPRR